MDDELFGGGRSADDTIYTDTVGIYVDAEWGSGTQSGVQLCPAVLIPSARAIPRAVKHIYSRLATAATELDQGVPELLLSLVGTGNSFSFENSDRLIRGLGQLLTQCALWGVTSGEQTDPLAVAMASALRSTLTHADSPEETLLIVVNCADVQHAAPSPMVGGTPERENPAMTDARLNTFYLLWNKSRPDEEQLLLFRAATAIKLANPPPALLIGVPEERASGLSVPFSTAQTPLGSPSSQAILLPSSPSVDERQPLPVVLFCGASLCSLVELCTYIQCGVPALVVQDISELCVVLRSAFALFQSTGFEHRAFEAWLEQELRMVALATAGTCAHKDISDAKQRVLELLLTVSTSEHSLLTFIAAHQMDRLGDQLLDLLVRSVPDAAEMGRALQLAVKVGAARTVNGIRLEGLVGEEVARLCAIQTILVLPQQIAAMLGAALASDDRIGTLAALLDQKVPIRVNSELLLGWLAGTGDQYFFNSIILGHFLRINGELRRIDEYVARRLNRLLYYLCGGVSASLFPYELFASSPTPIMDQERAIRALAIWALLLHRPKLVRLFCAYSAEPLALGLALAKAARTLGRKTRSWLFYDQPLRRLAHQLSRATCQLLDTAHTENPVKAYNALCKPLSNYRQLTLTQLAFETNARDFLAHECCQRWVLRLLYGRIQLRNLSHTVPFPCWLKICLSALFVVPILWWVRLRQERPLGKEGQRPTSPTVALLEDGRQMKKMRSSSANSMHSARSGPFLMPPSRDDPPRSVIFPIHSVPMVGPNGQAEVDAASPTQGLSTNDDSTLTDSFLPSASQFKGNDEQHNRESTFNRPQSRRSQRDLLEAQRSASRRQSPDRKSLMFSVYDGINATTPMSRRRSRTSRLLELGGMGVDPNRSGHGVGPGCCTTLSMFYATPITKYWLSLAFRLLYLAVLAWSVALPSCGLSADWEILLWLWALCWLLDSLWVFVCAAQHSHWSEQRWALFDLGVTGTFLSTLLAMRIGWWASTYSRRGCWALFLLYECYKTMFMYVPLSHVFGPMLVRIRLMITRDLVNFLLLILLVLLGNAIAIKAALYPDLSASPATIGDSLRWTAHQLFTTDFSVLHESGECQRQLLPDRRPQCQGIGGYANPRCPAQGWLSQFSVFEYFVFLKLLMWPILFALFARTAKRVEEEADHIWKYQLYSLATAFSVRPCFPPPLTPFFLILFACCRFGGGGLACIFRHGAGHCVSSDHPDIGGQAPNSPQRKYSSVYKNPSVPLARGRRLCNYWRRLAIAQWKAAQGGHPPDASPAHPHPDKANLLAAFSCFRQQMDTPGEGDGAPTQSGIATNESNDETGRLRVNPSQRSWLCLQPHYRPSSYSKAPAQFPADAQKHVEDHTAHGLVEVGRQWRQRRINELLARVDKPSQTAPVLLSGDGIPLNPAGRTGLAGRGELARFGPNRMLLYALFRRLQEEEDKDIQVLVLSQSGQFPSRWRPSGRTMVDEYLAQLLLQLGLSDPEIHALSSKTALANGERDGWVAHVCTERVDAPDRDTDNAWTEAQLWAVELSAFPSLHQLPNGGDYAWRSHTHLGAEQRRFMEKTLALFSTK